MGLDAKAIRNGWETELDLCYDSSRDYLQKHAPTTEIERAHGGVSVCVAIMRGMQDTIDELRSRLAYLEGKK